MKRVQRKGRKTRRKTRRPRKQRGGAPEDTVPVDELYGFKFPYVLTVTFSNGKVADGSIFDQVDTVQEPSVTWTPPDSSVFRTLLCFDPDAKARSWLHWLVVNATNDSPLSGETFMSWAAPSPAVGVHRYYFCLFEHLTKVRPDSEPKERGYFDVRKLIDEYGMQPVADSMIRVVAS